MSAGALLVAAVQSTVWRKEGMAGWVIWNCTYMVQKVWQGKEREFFLSANSLVDAAGEGKLSFVKELFTTGADVNIGCECHGKLELMGTL